MDHNIDTELLCLKDIVDKEYCFVIPSYQRPYVWSELGIEDFFEDIYQAFKNKEEHYFIGTTLSSKKEKEGCISLELIDGQQRVTTLMLFALAYREQQNHPINKVFIHQNRPRLNFEIRKSIEHYFYSQAKLKNFNTLSHDEIMVDPYLKHIHTGLKVIHQKMKATEQDLICFLDYMYTRVCWVNNIIPATTDLNKLFASMNTSGIQLEPVDILKAKFLKRITKDKQTYSLIWEVCQNMNIYFDRAIRKKLTKTSWNRLKYSDLAMYCRDTFEFEELVNNNDKISALCIDDIVAQRDFTKINEQILSGDHEDEDDIAHYRSFISFELLLIHTLRVYKISVKEEDIHQRITVSNLQIIFSEFLANASEADVKDFLKMLWQVRYQFDTWCVKWLESETNPQEELRLSKVDSTPLRKRNMKAYYMRSIREHNALEMLQCVRILTGERQVQYWLTPFLLGLIYLPIKNEQMATRLLEHIDNELSVTEQTQKEASYAFSNDLYQVNEIDEIKPTYHQKYEKVSTYLQQPKGTYFEHYWFQKLEYILWKEMKLVEKDKKFMAYRITAKNSIEHVRPQKERYEDVLQTPLLNSFGNLVLLSPGQNSEYSNKAVNVKRAEFKAKPVYDSLKLKKLFDVNANTLDQKSIQQHQKEMLMALEKHYQ